MQKSILSRAVFGFGLCMFCGLLLMAKRFAMKMIRGQFVDGTNNIIDLNWCDNGSEGETQKNESVKRECCP